MTVSPFQRLLGADFERLPAPVCDLHSLNKSLKTGGLADITAAPGVAASLLRWFGGLPQPGRDVPVTVAFHPDGKGRERWDRRFGSRRYASTMAAGRGSDTGLLVEHFGPFRLHFRLTPYEDGLAWSLVRWRFLRLPLPHWTTPSIECLESEDGGRFVFDIDVAFPIRGTSCTIAAGSKQFKRGGAGTCAAGCWQQRCEPLRVGSRRLSIPAAVVDILI
jgi:hypothetical protein